MQDNLWYTVIDDTDGETVYETPDLDEACDVREDYARHSGRVARVRTEELVNW